MTTEKDLLTHLRHEVDDLKKKLEHPAAQTKELLLEMESLKEAIHELNAIFKKALKEAKDDDLSGSLRALKEDMKTVLYRTETLAQRLGPLADVHRAPAPPRPGVQRPPFGQMPPSPVPGMLPHRMGAPSLPGLRMAPPPLPENSMPNPTGTAALPPPPPPPSARKERKLF